MGHDVIAFLTSVAEHIGPASRFVHQGMTSSDLLDTSFALQIREAGVVLRVFTAYADGLAASSAGVLTGLGADGYHLAVRYLADRMA